MILSTKHLLDSHSRSGCMDLSNDKLRAREIRDAELGRCKADKLSAHNNISPMIVIMRRFGFASCPRLFMQHLLSHSARTQPVLTAITTPRTQRPAHLLQSNVVRTCSHNLIYLSSTGKRGRMKPVVIWSRDRVSLQRAIACCC